MKYMLLIYRDEAALQPMSGQMMTEMTGAYLAYTKTLRDSGAFVAGDRLGRPTPLRSGYRMDAPRS